MRSFPAVIVAATNTNLTTLERVKAELSLADSDASKDDILETRIAEASSAIAAYLRRCLAIETLAETFRLENEAPEFLSLRQWPVRSVTSVLEDGLAVDPSQYELNPDTGVIYRLDASGYRYVWIASKTVVVTYVAGYALPDDIGRNLPAAIEQGAVKLVCDMHFGAGRDSRIKGESIPGVSQMDYWVGSIGENGLITPDVGALLDPYRRAF